MRRFLSLFMVLLLALRGLAGDAMAMELGSAPAHHMGQEQSKEHNKTHSQSHEQTLDEMATMAQHMHHEMHPKMPHDTDSAYEAVPSNDNNDCHPHEGHCTACGICHSTLARAELLHLQACAAPALPLTHGAARFASAAAFELIKPPISAL